MFGDKTMFGQNELTVGDNGRIFIPASTKREVGEELVLLYNDELKIYEIYSISKLE